MDRQKHREGRETEIKRREKVEQKGGLERVRDRQTDRQTDGQIHSHLNVCVTDFFSSLQQRLDIRDSEQLCLLRKRVVSEATA